MSVFLHAIQLSNFKSFCGLREIGPLYPNTLHAIIGPNGVGKSNLIDAIAFCTGEKLSNLRVKKLEDLIYKSAITGVRDTFVAIILRTKNGKEMIFKRSIIRNSSQYQLNGQIITRVEYHGELRAMSINVAARNFIIHQNDINSMWVMDRKERTALFEQMTHSIDFKNEYDRLFQESEELNSKAKELQDEKKKLIASQKMLRAAESKKHFEQKLLEDYDKTRIESFLLDLYFIELKRKEFRVNAVRIDEESEKLRAKIHEAERILQDKENELLGLNTTATEVEKKADDAQKKFNQIESVHSENQQKISMCEKQLLKLEKSLATAIAAHQAHEVDMAQLKESLREVTEAKDRYIEQCSQQFEKPLEEMAEWDRKYDALTTKVMKKTAKFHNKMILLERKRQPLLNKIENENRKHDEIKSNIARNIKSKEDIAKRMNTMNDNIQRTEKEIEDKSNLLIEMRENIESSVKLRQTLEDDLKIIREQLMECDMSRAQRDKVVEEKNIVQTLRRSFGGVHDRIYKLLHPIHDRYKIAFTKVFGHHFSNIIVDTTATARKCIKYLKDNRIGVATFLPLDDHLRVHKLKERLRSFEELEGVPNVKLLYDVIKFPHEVERIVLHIARNTLVCETAAIANHVAYDLPSGNKYNCVALDGVYFHKSGMFSGGTVSLEEKSRMLNAASREEIDLRKDEICEALRKIRNSENQGDVGILEVEINVLRKKLKFFRKYSDKMEKESESLEDELEKLNDDLQAVEKVIAEIEVEVSTLNAKIEAVQVEINKVKDPVFAKFCSNLGIANIRKYEESWRSFKEMKLRELEYDSQYERIQSLLKYEETRNMQYDVPKLTEKAECIRSQIDRLRSEGSNLKKQYNMAKDILSNCRNTLEVTLTEITKLKEKIARDEESLRKMLDTQKLLGRNELAVKVMENFRRRHNLLIEAKINDIALPLLDGGSLESITDCYLIGNECESSQELIDIYEREDGFKFDYSYLATKPKSVTDEIGLIDIKAQLKEKLADLECKISELDATTNTSQEMQKKKAALEEVDRRLVTTLKARKEIQLSFTKIKQQRLKAFMGCYENAVATIDKIYKQMNNDDSAQAILSAENEEEPYLAGLCYVCVPPKKRHCAGELSGGESAIASLSLIFSIQSMNPSPFLLLDEVDAAFDPENRKNVASYINSIKDSQQIIAISLKKQWFSNADSFIGVYKDQRNTSQGTSSIILLDLSEYQ